MKALIERLKRPSLALKLCAAFLALVFGVVLIINIYPVALARDLVSANKRSSMLDQASLLSTSLGALETLTENGVYQAMELLDTSASYRIIVTDEKAEVLYDNYPVDSSVGKYAMLSEIYLALNSKVVFYSRYADEAFLSRAAMPVTSGGAVIGAVYLSEYDSEQSSLISGISSTMFRLSILLSLVSLVLILVFSSALTRRISDLVRAVNIVREGDYDYHIDVVGSDEVSALANEFNSMTDRLRETEERRRRFVSDASHELKTPLASIRLLSDSIMQTENMDTATMREFIFSVCIMLSRIWTRPPCASSCPTSAPRPSAYSARRKNCSRSHGWTVRSSRSSSRSTSSSPPRTPCACSGLWHRSTGYSSNTTSARAVSSSPTATTCIRSFSISSKTA